MKRTGFLVASILPILTALPALAQQGAENAPGPYWGYHHMSGGPWGWHPGMMIGPFVMFFMIVGCIALVMWLTRGFRHGGMCGHYHRSGALDVLEQRFARGEIGKEEFEEKRKLLGR